MATLGTLRQRFNENTRDSIAVWKTPWFVIGKSFASAWSFFMLSQRYNDVVLDHAFLVSAIVAWVALFVLARRFLTMADKPLFSRLAFALMLGGTLAVAYPLVGTAAIPHPLLLFGLVLSGIGFALIFNLWFEFYGRLAPIRVVFYLCLDILLVELLDWFFSQMTGLGYFVGLICCTVIAPIAVSQSYLFLGKDGIDENKGDTPTTYPWKLYAALFVYIFAATFCKSLLNYQGGFFTIGYIITAVLVLVSLLFINRFRMMNFYRLAMPILVAGFFSTLIIDPTLSIGWTFANIAYSMMLMFSRVETCYLSYCYKYNICKLFCLFNIFNYVAIIVGEDLLGVLNRAGVVLEDQTMAIGCCILIVIVSTFLLLNEESWKTKPLKEVKLEKESSDRERDESLYRHFANAYGLGPREVTVLQLLLEGKTSRGIASELFIAQGTVKVHTRNIYKKLDIHSRDELVDLMERFLQKAQA